MTVSTGRAVPDVSRSSPLHANLPQRPDYQPEAALAFVKSLGDIRTSIARLDTGAISEHHRESAKSTIEQAGFQVHRARQFLKLGDLRSALAGVHDAMAGLGGLRIALDDNRHGVLTFDSLSSKLEDFGVPPGRRIAAPYHDRASAIEESIRSARAIVVGPGGLGTHFRLAFAVQLKQLNIISRDVPIICVDKPQYGGMFSALKRHVLEPMATTRFASIPLLHNHYLDLFTIVRTEHEARQLLPEDLFQEPGAHRTERGYEKMRSRLERSFSRLRDIERELWELHLSSRNTYSAAMMGTARKIPPTDAAYQRGYRLAYLLSRAGIDIYTGGGPGLMEAGTAGGIDGGGGTVYGITVDLGSLQGVEEPNARWNIERNHKWFGTRAPELCQCHAIAVDEGGIGSWFESAMRLHQGHCKRFFGPTVFMGGIWQLYDEYMREYFVRGQFTTESELAALYSCMPDPDEAAHLIIQDKEARISDISAGRHPR